MSCANPKAPALHPQELQKFVDQEAGPEDSLENAEKPVPEARGRLDEVDQCADEPETIDCPRSGCGAVGLEIYRERLILYGCGDFLNDYEGISGYEEFRADLVLAYLPALDAATGRLHACAMVPFRLRRFRLERADAEETEWLRGVLARRSVGADVLLGDGNDLRVEYR